MGSACTHEEPVPKHVLANSQASQINKEAAITNYMMQSEKKDRSVVKILLLGSGSSGKSTLLRQIDHLHGDQSPRESYAIAPYTGHGSLRSQNMPYVRRSIRTNCITALFKLLKQSLVLADKPFSFADVHVDIATQETEDAIKLLAQWVKEVRDDPGDTELSALGVAMAHLWKLPGVRNTFRHRHHFSLIENADFFLDRVEEIMTKGYVPPMEHSIKARMRTLGIIEESYKIRRVDINIFDVGGQRNERRKWLSLFDCVDVLIFVAALNHYSCALFEDESKNAMRESLELFREMVNSKWFPPHYTRFVLFLNKDDQFRHRLIVDKVPLSVAFDDEYQASNFADKEFEDPLEQSEWEECCYNEALSFIKEKYLHELGVRHKVDDVFVHVTTATNLEVVKDAFNLVIEREVAMLNMH